jgi:hypothetical protein
MLTSILSAVCAIALGTNAIASQADTLNVYVINGETIENFDGSQLVGKTISDYKTMISSSISNGVTSVTKMHVIKTDGKQIKSASNYSVVTNGEISKVSIAGLDGEYSLADIQVNEGAKEMEIYIDGKKSSRADMGKILPEKISSMNIYRAGSADAIKYTGSKDKNVIIVELKK